MLASKTRWKTTEIAAQDIAKWQEQLGISSLVSKLLISRGYTNPEDAKEMVRIEEMDFHDPFLLDGMKEAVQRIQLAIENKEKIRIYGDYDCDGVSSTTIMVHILRECGAIFDFYIPNRFTEGYGLNKKAIDLAKEEGISLIITVDTGISAKQEVEYGTGLGLDFIITDHHEPPAELPQCTAVVNPKKPGCSYPYKYLAGAGVAFKLGQALLSKIPKHLLDIAAIGTIADLVPLQGENRLIAYQGLKVLNHTKHIGLEALIKVAGIEDIWIDEQKVGFSLGPRINASGRLETADKAVRLLISEDREEAEILAEEINLLNKQRQGLVDELTKEAIAWVEERYPTIKPKALVVAKENWNVGVIGIVASRLVEKYYVPTIVLGIDPSTNKAKGSARSIEGFDLYKALTECKEILPHFGGHPMAAGMTLAADDLELLRSKMAQLAEQWLTDEDFVPITPVDLSCTIEEITIDAIEELEKLAPFGVGNPKPRVLLEQVRIKELRPVGASSQHLKCQFVQDFSLLDGIGFGFGELSSKISLESKIDLVGQLAINEWNGLRKPQMMIEDLRVTHCQFFDWRGAKQLEQKWNQLIYDQGVAFICCREYETNRFEEFPDHFKKITWNHLNSTFHELGSYQAIERLDEGVDTVVLYDLPRNQQQLDKVCLMISSAKRVFVIFHHQDEHFFSTLPGRDHFKWFYAFLHKKGQFNIAEHAEALAKHKGWSLDTVHFMTEVFLELEFVKIVDGVIQLESNATKKDLSESRLYQEKQDEIQLEQELLYSSFSEMIQTLESKMESNHLEEAYAYGF